MFKKIYIIFKINYIITDSNGLSKGINIFDL